MKSKECPQDIIDREKINPLHKILVLYNEIYRDNIVLDKNKCKTPKFHQLLHTSFYIKIHGVFSNFDVSIRERIGKEVVKNMSVTSKKDRNNLNLSISTRCSEKQIVKLLIYIQENFMDKKY